MAPPLPPMPVGQKLTDATSAHVVVEMFHDVCCPYSKKMYDTVFTSVIPALEKEDLLNKIEFIFHSVPQPWHAQSCCMHDAVMAAAILDRQHVGTYIFNIFADQANFFDDKIKDMSRVQLYQKLADIAGASGYDAAAIADKLSLETVQGNGGLGDVTQQLKWAVKYHRNRGVHTTPTVFINDTEAGDVSSGWLLDDWLGKLLPMLRSN